MLTASTGLDPQHPAADTFAGDTEPVASVVACAPQQLACAEPSRGPQQPAVPGSLGASDRPPLTAIRAYASLTDCLISSSFISLSVAY